jgi:hypothetical protein
MPRIPAYFNHKIWVVEQREKCEASIGYLPLIAAAGESHYPLILPTFETTLVDLLNWKMIGVLPG